MLQILLFGAVLIAIVPLLGGYMARVFTADRLRFSPTLTAQSWKGYAGSVILFSAFSWLVLYVILRTQTLHPFNRNGFHSGTWDLTFNTVSSFVTNTNWQYYGGETTLSNFSQMTGLAVQNFASAGVGLAVAIAFIRGLTSRELGNFWQDLTRALVYVLLPI